MIRKERAKSDSKDLKLEILIWKTRIVHRESSMMLGGIVWRKPKKELAERLKVTRQTVYLKQLGNLVTDNKISNLGKERKELIRTPNWKMISHLIENN